LPPCADVARRRVGRRDALRHDLGCTAERRIVEHREILVDRATGGIGWQAFLASHEALAVGLGADEARIDRKAIPADQPLGHAALHRRLEQLAQQIAVAEAAVPVLGEGRVVGNVAVETQSAKPAIGEIEVDLVAQLPLRADAKTIADDQHPDRQLGVDRRSAHLAVKGPQMLADRGQIDEPVDRAEQVIRRHVPLEAELVKQRFLRHRPLAHHRPVST